MQSIWNRFLLKFGETKKKVDYEVKISDSHEIMLSKMNIYFSEHSNLKEKYSKELAFINEVAALKQNDNDRKIYSIYPYAFTLKYSPADIEVFWDNDAEMFYVLFGEKRMYYHKGFTSIDEVQMHYMSISAEQDTESPHKYFNDKFSVGSKDVVADLGAAEGNFALSIVEKVKELYLVESDPAWVEALFKTFEPWKDKVHIIQKSAGTRNDADTLTLGELFNGTGINVLKMDIEGAEVDVLRCGLDVLLQRELKLIITTYHRKNDASDINKMLESNGYRTNFSDNYMLYIWDNLTPPYFRKGLIIASK